MSVLDYLINDIKNIVYRYVHLFNYTQCMQQYNILYQDHWNHETLKFWNEEKNMELMWRNSYVREYEGLIFPIFDSCKHGKCYKVPKNY